MQFLIVTAVFCSTLCHFTLTDSDSKSEPRYLDKFSLQFGGGSDSIKRSYKPKRQTNDDPEVDSILSELLLREQSERRTFPGSNFVVKGAQNINDDLHQILSDILDGVDDDDNDFNVDNSFIRGGHLTDDEQRILGSLRELDEESVRKPVRFGGFQKNPDFSDDFAVKGLRNLGDRDDGDDGVRGPNLANRGRFDSSGQSNRGGRQGIRETVNPDGSIERCENTGFETRQRTECNNVPETVCETVDRVKYRTEIVPQCRTRVETECNETTIHVPKEECVQAFEKKCETEYKVIEKYSYKEECTEVIEEVCKEHVEIPVPVEVPYPVPVPKPVEVPVYEEKIIPVYKHKPPPPPEYTPTPHYQKPTPDYLPPKPDYLPPKPDYLTPKPDYLTPKPDYPVPPAPPVPHVAVPAVPPPALALPHHEDPHHPAIPTHGPHIHHDLLPPQPFHQPHLVTPLPNLDPLKASIVDKFNNQLIRSKRDSKSDPDAKAFPDPEPSPEPEAEAIAAALPEPRAEASAEAESNPEAEGRKPSIHDLSIDELQSLLHSINGGKLLKTSSPPQRPLGSHVLDLSTFKGTSNLNFPADDGGVRNNPRLQSQSLFTSPSLESSSHQREALGGDLLADLMSRERSQARERDHFLSSSGSAVSLLGNSPTASVRLGQLSDQSSLLANFRLSDQTNINSFLSEDFDQNRNRNFRKQKQFLTNEEIQQLMQSSPRDNLSVQSKFSEVKNLNNLQLSPGSASASTSSLNSDLIFAGEGREEKLPVDTRQTQLGEPFLGGHLDTSLLTDEVVSKVMEHLRMNKAEFQIPPVPPPPPPPPSPPPPPPPPGVGGLHHSLLPGLLGGVLVPPSDPNIINDHFPLPHNPLPPHHDPHPAHQPLHHHRPHPVQHHAAIQEIVNLHKPQPLHYDLKEELHVKHNPEPHGVHHPPQPVHHPDPVIIKTEIEAPPGCKAYSTRTCKKTPIAVPEKVPVPKCYDIPKVECFHVLSPAPDLACAPKAVEDCMDTVKEVPYLAPEEKCYEVPREECRDITEQVPVVVCTQIDQTREPKATLVSPPYGRLTRDEIKRY